MTTDYTKNTSKKTRRTAAVPNDELHIDHPPRGIKMEQAQDGATVIKVRMFSRSVFPMFFFALIWNAVISLFVAIAIGMTAAKLGYGMGFFTPEEPNDTWTPVLIIWGFLIPFIAIGLFLIQKAAYGFLGRLEIRINTDEGSVFKGFGQLGRTQRFAPKSVKSIGMDKANEHEESIDLLFIKMNNGRTIKFPSLNEMRETWLAFALRKLLGKNS